MVFRKVRYIYGIFIFGKVLKFILLKVITIAFLRDMLYNFTFWFCWSKIKCNVIPLEAKLLYKAIYLFIILLNHKNLFYNITILFQFTKCTICSCKTRLPRYRLTVGMTIVVYLMLGFNLNIRVYLYYIFTSIIRGKPWFFTRIWRKRHTVVTETIADHP